MLKPVRWLGSSRAAMRNAPEEVRIDGGYELYQLQLGREPLDWKPMASIGPGTRKFGSTAHRRIECCTWLSMRTLYTSCMYSRRSGAGPVHWTWGLAAQGTGK